MAIRVAWATMVMKLVRLDVEVTSPSFICDGASQARIRKKIDLFDSYCARSLDRKSRHFLAHYWFDVVQKGKVGVFGLFLELGYQLYSRSSFVAQLLE